MQDLRRVEIDRTDGVISWYINQTMIASRFDDSTDSGSIMLGYMALVAGVFEAASQFAMPDSARLPFLTD